MMSKTYTIYCTNCGESGHSTKQCLQPITSFGTIIFRVRDGYNQTEALLQSDTNLNGLEAPNASRVEYLLIKRRDSLGFIDIIRGKYRLGDIEYIKQLQLDDLSNSNFKCNNVYNDILEHVSYELGVEYLKLIQSDFFKH